APGIEPYYPACQFQAGADAIEQIVCQVVPGSAEVDFVEAVPPTSDDEPALVRRRVARSYVPPPAEDDASAEPATAAVEELEIVAQKTRYLRLGNGTKKKTTFFLRYHAPDDDGQFAWFPGEADDPIEITLAPGEVVDVFDGDWHVHADRVF